MCKKRENLSNLKANGEEAQGKPLGLQGMGLLNKLLQQNIIRIIHTKNQWQSYRALPCRYSNNFYNFSLQDPETEIANCKWWVAI